MLSNIPSTGSIERRFRLYYPPSYDPFAATWLVLDYHGYGNSATSQESNSGIRAAADAFNYIAVRARPRGPPRVRFCAYPGPARRIQGVVTAPPPTGVPRGLLGHGRWSERARLEHRWERGVARPAR